MADKIFHSTAVTFVDMTDSRTLDVYIASNHPTVQIYDSNKTTSKYTPDWSVSNLRLEASFYLDSQSVAPNSIKWYTKIGTIKNELTSFEGKNTLLIATNALSSDPIISYICEATYDTLSAFKEITFTRVNTGVNGANGASAPIVQAQYSVDGKTNWTSTLDTAIHKYIRYSYDGGTNWTTEIKIVGEDGTSVRIRGTATSKTLVSGTSYYTLVYNSAVITGATLGDAYLLETDGHLYVCVDSRNGEDHFMDVGEIKGPKGNDGISEYVYIKYAPKANPNNSDMTSAPSSTTTHIGICVSTATSAPPTASSYTWSKFVGDSAKSIILSGDSQMFKVAKSSTSTTPNTITINAIPVNITDTNNIAWSYRTNNSTNWSNLADGSTKIEGGIDRSGNQAVVTGKNLTSTITSITFKASYGSIEDVFTIYKASDGVDGDKGDPASMAFLTNENVTLSADANGKVSGGIYFQTNVVAYKGANKDALTIDNIGTITGIPNGISVTKTNADNNEVTITFQVDTNGSTLGSTSNNNGSIIIPVNGPSVYTSLVLSWSKVNSGAKGEKGNDGANAYTVLLTNESHVFAGGVDSALAGTAETQILAYLGSTQQKVKILEVNDQSAATIKTNVEGVTGLQFACDTISEADSPKITFTCTTAFKGKTNGGGTIPIKLSVGGVIFTKMFTYSIAFKGSTGGTGAQGLPGENSTSYWLISSASAVQKTSTGTITVTPSNLTFTGKSQTGANTPIDYACRWIIDYSTDGTTYTNLYTSTVNEVSKSITVATTYKTIRVRMYVAGGTTALLDEQIIPIVSDGVPGTSASFVDVTPSAYFFKSTKGKDGVFTPDYIYLYPRFQTVTYSKWQYYNDSTSSWVDIVSGSNGLTIGTYNSTANSLQIAKSSSLYTDLITSVSFRCVSSNTSVYDTVSIAKIYDVVDLQIGGRNLAEKTNQGITNWGWSMQTGDYTREEYIDSNNIKCCKLTKGNATAQSGWSVIEYMNIGLFKYEPNQIYTISFDVLSNVNTVMSVRLLQPNGTNDLGSTYTGIKKTVTENVWSKIIYTVTTVTTLPTLVDQCLYINAMSSANGVSYIFKNVKIEKGNKATDWTPAPEDLINEASNVNVMLSNEAHFFEANASGIPTATNIVLDVFGYKGSIQSATTVGTITGLPSAGMTATIASNNTTSTKITISVTSALTSTIADSGVLTIPITVNGHTINKKFSWSKSKEGAVGTPGVDAVTFRIYSTEGYILSANTPSITLQTFAYVGDVAITAGATYQWYSYNNGAWTAITGGTNNHLSIARDDVSFSNGYMCKMIFGGVEYVDVVTIEDKSDNNQVFVSKPSNYSIGDIWIVSSDYIPPKMAEGVLLKAVNANKTYADADWITATAYDSRMQKLENDISTYNNYFDFDTAYGIKITAKDEDGNVSPFSTTLSHTRLSFNQGAEAVAYIESNKMKIKEAEIESPLSVTGKKVDGTVVQYPVLNIGNFSLVVESNGSLSIIANT